MDSNINDKNSSVNADDEFVVPHMDIACLQNSLAYQKVLEEPWTYLYNWSTLAPSVQQELAQSFLATLGELKSEIAVTQGVFDPYLVTNTVSENVTAEETRPTNPSEHPTTSASAS